MEEKLKEILAKIKNNSFIKYNKLSVIGTGVVILGVIGFIPSIIMSVPFIVETAEATQKKLELSNKKTINIDDIDNVEVLSLDTSDDENKLWNVFIDKSDTGYSYINIISTDQIDVELTVAKEENKLIGKFNSEAKEKGKEKTQIKSGMTTYEAIDTLSNNFIGNQDEIYHIEIYLHKPIDLDLSKHSNHIEVRSTKNVKALTSGTYNVNFKNNERIETLNIIENENFVSLDENTLNSANNINIDFNDLNMYSRGSEVRIQTDGRLKYMPQTININADRVYIESNNKLADSLNIDAYSSVEINQSGDSIRNSFAVNSKGIGVIEDYNYNNEMEQEINWKESEVSKMEYNKYFISDKENRFTIGEREGMLEINILNYLENLSIHR
ncbi:MAG: hypothetical protein ACRC57_06575 [Sarcina sp.]